jgi:tetratricopeptide (TPR) repeat protein
MIPIDWNTAPWLAPLDDISEHRRGQHRFALHILGEYERSARPFVLFLSTYRNIQLYGEDGSGYGEFLLPNAIGSHLNHRGIEMIAVQDQSALLADTKGASARWFKHVYAELRLTDAMWLDAVRELIRRAELIVVACESLTPGLSSELRTCQELGRVDRTVVILPVSPPYASLDNASALADFTRAVHGDRLGMQAPLDHFVIRDLVERLATINGLPQDERLRLMRKDDIDTRFPIGTATLFQGYQSESTAEGTRERKDRVAFCYSRLAQLARLSGDVQTVAVSLTELHMARWAIGDFDRSLDALLEAAHRLDAAEPHPPGVALTTAQVRQRMQDVVLTPVQPMLADGRTSDAFEFLTELLKPIRRWHDRAMEALCLSKWAEAEIREKRYEDALQTIDKTLTIARDIGDRFREAFATYLRGTAFQSQGDDALAANTYNEALTQLPRPGVYEMEWAVFMNIGGIAERHGDLEKARAVYAGAVACADALGMPQLRATATAALSRIADATDSRT